MRKEKKMEEERKKENSTKLQKPNIEAKIYNYNKKCDWIYTYTYTPISKIKTVLTKIKYNGLTQWTEETKNYIYWNKTN